VLIADDHPLYSATACGRSSSAPRTFELAGEATTGAEAVELAATSSPSIVLMDLRMPEMTGIDATRRILERDPSVGILIITMSEDDESLFAAMRAGARATSRRTPTARSSFERFRAAAVGEVIFGRRSPTG